MLAESMHKNETACRMSDQFQIRMNNVKPVLIFDGDDTLWDTMPLYDKAKRQYFLAMEALGFESKLVEREFEERDVSNVDRLGFSKKRLETSMVETYRAFCVHRNRVPAMTFENRIKRIARSVFGTKPKPVRHARQVLRKLQKSCRLILLTKGEASVQRERIRTSGLESFFDDVVVVPHKDTKTFTALLRRYRLPLNSTWSVGNSLRSDINPALRAGLKTIWVARRTWGYEDEKHIGGKGVKKISSLTEIPKVIEAFEHVK